MVLALAMVAVGGCGATDDEDDAGQVDASDDAASDGAASDDDSEASSSSTTATTAPHAGPAVPAAPPPLVVALTEGGRLVVIDAGTGAQVRELAFHGDPAEADDPTVEGSTSFIEAVGVAPDGGTVYYSTCCEPAPGSTFQVPIGGGEPERVADGGYPAVSPDGTSLAVVDSAFGVKVSDSLQLPLDFGRFILVDDPLTVAPRSAAWSPDGTQLAVDISGDYEHADAAPAERVVVIVEATATRLDEGRRLTPPGGTTWSSPAFRPDGTLIVIETADGVAAVLRSVGVDAAAGDTIDLDGRIPLDVETDSSGGWVVVTTDAGLVVLAPDGTASEVPVDDRFTTADW
ncbi:hypothetical protein BH18ACT4_BH18ACT4_13020 [soil metagenome]